MRGQEDLEMIMFEQTASGITGHCDWCEAQLASRIFHYEDKRYCCRACLDSGVAMEISRPLFETKPFPHELRRLRAQIPQLY